LDRLELFAGLPDAALVAVAGVLWEAAYDSGQEIEVADEEGEAFLAIVAGEAQVRRVSPGGKGVILETLEAGDVSIFPCLSPRERAGATVEASVNGTVVYCIPLPTVWTFGQSEPEAARRILTALTARYGLLCDRFGDVALNSVRTRLAHEIARAAERRGDRHVVRTHEELAELIAESLSVFGGTSWHGMYYRPRYSSRRSHWQG
jgi:CRP-like cAMP-binding protein